MSRKLALTKLKTQDDALAYLQENHHEFFKDEGMQGLAAAICLEMAEPLSKLKPLDRLTVITSTISLMYLMGSAAIESASTRTNRNNMTKIFIEDYPKKRKRDEEEN